MKIEQGDKVTAVYLWNDNDGRWPDTVILRPASDVCMDKPPTRQVGYVRGDEAKSDLDRLEKTVISLVDFIESDGDRLCDVAPHFAEMLDLMGLYRSKEDVDV